MTKAKILIILMSIIGLNSELQAQSNPKKVLVVYFSHSGNTKVIAGFIKDATAGDIFEIKPEKDYPIDYNTVVEQAEKEINANYKPELKTKISNIEKYDMIFVGSPNWWGTFAPPVASFLSSYNLSGKTIVPFITHEGSGLGRSVSNLKKLCPKSIIAEGYACRGSNVRNARNEVAKWAKKIKMAK